eukprot:symbB.v1.2.011914.t4/scaffold794.1/size161992/7
MTPDSRDLLKRTAPLPVPVPATSNSNRMLREQNITTRSNGSDRRIVLPLSIFEVKRIFTQFLYNAPDRSRCGPYIWCNLCSFHVSCAHHGIFLSGDEDKNTCRG